jgi:hypothetical protein
MVERTTCAFVGVVSLRIPRLKPTSGQQMLGWVGVLLGSAGGGADGGRGSGVPNRRARSTSRGIGVLNARARLSSESLVSGVGPVSGPGKSGR